MKSEYSMNTNLLHSNKTIQGMSLLPETFPLFATVAFSQKNMSDVKRAYAEKQYTYVRTRNPNRRVLADAISLLEKGEETFATASGMGAIFATLFALADKGDHVLCSKELYGETYEIMTQIMPRFGIEAEMISFQDLDSVAKHIKPNTKVIYTEIASNPCIQLTDIEGLAQIAHENGAYLVVDNTFSSPINVQPLDMGADISINSLTKFLNGHSDALGGSASGSKELIDRITFVGKLTGVPITPSDAWMIYRGLQTAELRIKKQTENAAKLAKALEQNPHVERVYHPSLESHPQRELAKRQFDENGGTAMLSFIIPEDEEKIDIFMERLNLAKYAMTLGGLRTTLSHPCTSSHHSLPDPERRALGITPGMFRLSVGLEDIDDLIADFENALKAFD